MHHHIVHLGFPLRRKTPRGWLLSLMYVFRVSSFSCMCVSPIFNCKVTLSSRQNKIIQSINKMRNWKTTGFRIHVPVPLSCASNTIPSLGAGSFKGSPEFVRFGLLEMLWYLVLPLLGDTSGPFTSCILGTLLSPSSARPHQPVSGLPFGGIIAISSKSHP